MTKAAPPQAPPRALIGAMAALSGAAALVYQTLWMRGFSVAFGSTTTAAAVTLAAFMGGLALGGAWVRRWKRPGGFKEYGRLEAGIACLAAFSLLLLRVLPGAFGALLRQHPLAPLPELLLKASLAAACVLPAAILIGATLPVLVQCASSPAFKLTPNFSWLYRLNTLGAVAGVLLASFVLIPRLGLGGAGLLAILANLSIAWLARSFALRSTEQVAVPPTQASRFRLDWRVALLALALGLSTFVLEVAWMRSMALAVGSSVYAFELMLAALLLGTALGTRFYEAWAGRVGDPSALLGRLLPVLAGCVLLQAWLCGELPALYYQFIRHTSFSFAGHQVAVFLLAFAIMLPVTALQGFLFPLLLRLDAGTEAQPQAAAGALYAWNTVGAIAGALAAAFWLIPRWGVQAAFSWAAAPVLLAWAVTLPAPAWKRGIAVAASLAISGLAIHSYRPWNKLSVSSGPFLYALAQRERTLQEPDFDRWAAHGTELLSYEEGREVVVSVNRSGPTTSLKVNGKVDASNGDLEAFKLVAHVPLALHPGAKRAMLIGWGSGCSAGAAGLYPSLQSLDCAEIEPAVFDARRFFSFMNRDIDQDPRFHIFFEDGRNFLLKSNGGYDVILSQPSNPWMKGVASLFTQDFYELASAKLAPGGLFAQWFHFYQMSEADLKMVARTFASVFPDTSLWIVPSAEKRAVIIGDLVLVGSLTPYQMDPQRLKALWQDPRLAQEFSSLGLDSPLSFALNRMGGTQEIQAWAGPGPLNRDSHPILEYSAPRSIYLSREAIDQQNRSSFSDMEQASVLPAGLSDFPGSLGPSPAQQLRDAAELCALKIRYRQAEALLNAAQSRWPNDPHFDYAWAQVLLYKGDNAQSEARLKSFLRAEPGHREAIVRLGKLYLSERRFEEAAAYYSALQRRFPKEGEFFVGQGIALVKLERYADAMVPLKQAVKINPDDTISSGLLKKLEAETFDHGAASGI